MFLHIHWHHLLHLHQHHSHCSQHRSSRDTTSWTGHHGDSANVRRAADWWHHSHNCSRLGIVSSICAQSKVIILRCRLPCIRPSMFQCSWTRSPSLSPAVLLRRDRFRTMVNVMGDALATGIMAHICRKDFMKEGDGVSYCTNNNFIIIMAPVFWMMLDQGWPHVWRYHGINSV